MCASVLIPWSFGSNVEEQVWVWNEEYYYDKQDWVRLRVESETWHDLSPVAPAEREKVAVGERKSPYSITVSVSFSCSPLLVRTFLNKH